MCEGLLPYEYYEGMLNMGHQRYNDQAAIERLLGETVLMDKRNWALKLYAKLFLRKRYVEPTEG